MFWGSKSSAGKHCDGTGNAVKTTRGIIVKCSQGGFRHLCHVVSKFLQHESVLSLAMWSASPLIVVEELLLFSVVQEFAVKKNTNCAIVIGRLQTDGLRGVC